MCSCEGGGLNSFRKSPSDFVLIQSSEPHPGINDSFNLQFSKNIRYADSKISYRIADVCTLQKRADAERAFEILEEETILDFYPVKNNEEILITCEYIQRVDEDFFVVGEGGGDVITSGEFGVVSSGRVLLIRQSECPNPNIALHEILHALGFDHSSNENNIMYPIISCSQTLGEDIPELIDELYSIPSNPDLIIEDASFSVQEGNFDLKLFVANAGFKPTQKSILKIYLDDSNSPFGFLPLESLPVGTSWQLMFNLNSLDFDKLMAVVEYDFEELDKKNNKVIFDSKK